MTARGGTDSPWDADPVAPADAERMRSAAAELERFARATDVAPRAGLAGSIMSMVAVEPTPAPLTALSAATRRRRLGAMLAALRDAWRVTWSGGRPIAIRVSAAMAVLVLVITTGSVGGLAAMGAWTAVQPAPTTPAPSPSVDQVPVVVPPMQPSASPAAPAGTAAPTPSGSPAPTSSPGPAPSAAPTHTTRPTMKPTPRPTARPTVKPTHHPDPTSMPMPTHHPEPSHGTGHG
jgi:hypothetical protein